MFCCKGRYITVVAFLTFGRPYFLCGRCAIRQIRYVWTWQLVRCSHFLKECPNATGKSRVFFELMTEHIPDSPALVSTLLLNGFIACPQGPGYPLLLLVPAGYPLLSLTQPSAQKRYPNWPWVPCGGYPGGPIAVQTNG